jgi:methyltransferase family protein
MKRYRLLSGSLKGLRDQGALSSSTLAQLQPIMDLAFTREELLRAINRVIGDQNQEVIRTILSSADRFKLLRLKDSLASRWRTFVAPSRLVLPFRSYLSLRPIPFAVRFRVRYLVLSYLDSIRESANANTKGFQHNRDQVSSFLSGHRERTETLAILLRCIKNLDLKSSRTLCVGPRNEAEVLLLRQYGFGDVTAIDLFSYSPLISVMDMNSLAYPDDHFDIYYSSFVLSYSPDVTKTLQEAVRVTRPGGVHVFGFTTTAGEDRYGLTPKGSDIKSLDEFEARLRENMDHVYWRDSWRVGDQVVFTIIFRIKK